MVSVENLKTPSYHTFKKNSKCSNEDKKIFKEKESIEILEQKVN